MVNLGMPKLDSKSKFGNSIYVDNNNFIYSSDTNLLQTLRSENFTIELWCYQLNSPRHDWPSPFGISSLPTPGFNTYYDILRVGKYNTGATQTCINNKSYSWSQYMPLDSWHHVAFVRDNSNCHTFLDGKQVSLISESNLFTNANGFYIGAGGMFNQVCFYGYIDEVRISNISRWTSDFALPSEYYVDIHKLYLNNKDMYGMNI